MNSHPTKLATCFLIFALMVCGVVADDSVPGNEVLIDATFNNIPDGTLEAFRLISNNIGNPAWNNATGQASMSVNAASNGSKL